MVVCVTALAPTYNTHVQLAACLVFNVACVLCKHKVWSVTSLQSVCLVLDQSPSVSEDSIGLIANHYIVLFTDQWYVLHMPDCRLHMLITQN